MLSYIIIFIGKVVEVSIGTVRTVLNSKGEKLTASVLGVVETSIWLLVVSAVITNISNDPFKMVAYALGFGVGNYLGVAIEDKMAIGLLTVQIIISKEDGQTLADQLRDMGNGVTVIEGKGKTDEKNILIVLIQRKRKNEVLNRVKKEYPDAVVSANDVRGNIHGGFGLGK